MERATDREPRSDAETPRAPGFPDDPDGETTVPPVFASVDALGLDCAPAFDASAPLDPLIFAADSPDVPEPHMNTWRESAEAEAEAGANPERGVQ